MIRLKYTFILLSLLFFATKKCVSQIAIHTEPHGICWIYNNPKFDTTSFVIGKIYKNQAFWYDEKAYNNGDEWVKVVVPPSGDRFMKMTDVDEMVKGYTLSTYILPYNKLEKASVSDLSIAVDLVKFDTISHKVKGRLNWGVGSITPNNKVKKVSIKVGNRKVDFPQRLFSDLYNCNTDFEIYKWGDMYLAYTNNELEENSYELLFVIANNGIIKSRVVGNLKSFNF